MSWAEGTALSAAWGQQQKVQNIFTNAWDGIRGKESQWE